MNICYTYMYNQIIIHILRYLIKTYKKKSHVCLDLYVHVLIYSVILLHVQAYICFCVPIT